MPAPVELEEALAGIGDRDHTATSEYRIFGPPGTGKTTNLGRQIRRATVRFGPDSVLVTSFSRAAASELAGRDLPISPERIGTLHAHCYRALGRPPIAEAHVEEWNRKYPHWEITQAKKQSRLDGEEGGEEEGRLQSGDLLLQELGRSRGLMIPPHLWPAGRRDFAKRWEEYKRANSLMDFTDLIETCYRDMAVSPHQPEVVFVDEAQDLNRMQLALIRNWGRNCQYFIICGDEDQTIYSFAGASPEAMLDPPIPPDHQIVLKQSYRIPRTVHALADSFIRQVSMRYEKVYYPRPVDGAVARGPHSATYGRPDYWVLKTLLRHLEKGQSVMLLASCAYMLEPLIAVLRKWGIAFHNPYRRSCGFWNPLRLGCKEASANRILSLLVAHSNYRNGGAFRYDELQRWAGYLRPTGILKPNAMALIEQSDGALLVTSEVLSQLFEADALDSLMTALEGDHKQLLGWWQPRVAAGFRARVQFPVRVALRYGSSALQDDPKVIVGTIHSVKGGEADVVFLFPDLSDAGGAAYNRYGAQRDAVLRLFYVGITRARETLYVCRNETSLAVKI